MNRSRNPKRVTRAQWQIDAHGYWRSSGNRLISKEELKEFPVDSLQQVYREYSRGSVYNYGDHVKLAEDLDKDGKLPATFMVVARDRGTSWKCGPTSTGCEPLTLRRAADVPRCTYARYSWISWKESSTDTATRAIRSMIHSVV